VDPFLFENFFTEDGDLLRAKFKAFKFPASNFVLFKGVVNVCLDRCNSVECANGQLGYGKRRKRRSAMQEDQSAADGLKRLYEVSMSTIVRVEEDPQLSAADAAAAAGHQKLPVLAETQPETIPSARQRQQELLVEKAVLSTSYTPGRSSEHLVLEEELLAQEELGSFGNEAFVDFEFDEEDKAAAKRSSASNRSFAPLLASLPILTALRCIR